MEGQRDGQAREDSPTAQRRADYRPAGAAAKSGLFATLKRTATEFSEDNLSDWAAALTYYALLSLFPALIALVAVLGLVGDPQSTTSNRPRCSKTVMLRPISPTKQRARSIRLPRTSPRTPKKRVTTL